jgi:hypothetical protein
MAREAAARSAIKLSNISAAEARVSGWVGTSDANLKPAVRFDLQARAFPYSASKRVHAFSACGSL